ncbi:hypothetical protein PsorP6_007944 [Peronosclerospora sorghi]|uniref:Uncharacterized protein n=1 Tax=Peronosclerospora sorghi TaxID=230839 RepID=A0ACC0WA68_9STRA|nr:hypothetical protein PsorP6_007944 [Peronosclerospora sorghi]
MSPPSHDMFNRKLTDIHKEISQEQHQVLESLRSFYSSSSSISVDDAVNLTRKWGKRSHSVLPSEEKNLLPQSDEQETIARVNQVLLEAVDRLQLDERSDMAPEAQALVSLTQKKRLQAQVDELKDRLTSIDQVSEVDQLLSTVDEAIEHHNYLLAAKSIEKGETLVLTLSQLNEKEEENVVEEEKIVRALKFQLQSKKKRLLTQLTGFFSCLAAWSDNALEVTTCFTDTMSGMTRVLDEHKLDEVWTACKQMEMLTPTLKELAIAAAQHLIRPMVQMPRGIIEQRQDENCVILKVVAQSAKEDGNEAAEIEQKFTNVVKILQFIYTALFVCKDELMQQFGEFVWKIPGNLESQLMKLLQDNIPQDATALDAYKNVLANTIMSLENALVAIGFSACHNSQLRTVLEQLDQLYSTKRQQTILSIGRDLMRQSYRESVKVTGPNVSSKQARNNEEDPASNMESNELRSTCFQPPDYRVTACAHQVVELVHQTLVEACTCCNKSAKLLFQTARDLFLLFRTIIPTLYKEDIATNATTCMLYHNDCLYITYHVLCIEHVYKHRLPAPLNRTATMVDMVSIFREAGDKALNSYTSAQMEELLRGIKVLPSLDAIDSESNFEHVETFVENALSKLHCLHSSWHEGLRLATYNQIIAEMLEPLVQHFVENIFAPSKLNDQAVANLKILLSLLLKGEALFASPTQAAELVPSIARCSTLAAVLTDSLATVREKHRSGALNAFSSTELAALVKSFFPETLERNELLHELHAA